MKSWIKGGLIGLAVYFSYQLIVAGSVLPTLFICYDGWKFRSDLLFCRAVDWITSPLGFIQNTIYQNLVYLFIFVFVGALVGLVIGAIGILFSTKSKEAFKK